MRAKDDPKHLPLVERFNRKKVSLDKIFPTGNSPVIISKRQFSDMVKLWRDLAFEIDTYVSSVAFPLSLSLPLFIR